MKKYIISGSLLALALAMVFSPISAEAKSHKNKENNHKHSKDDCSIAFGHLIAPGWVKKHGVAKFDVDNCRGHLPFGIWKKLYGNYNHNQENDTVAPTVTSATVTNITNTSASIVVVSNEQVKAKVAYGTTNTYGTMSNLSTSFGTSQTITLSGLTANTVYHYQVTLADKAGNMRVTDDATFTTTNVAADTVAPTISGLSANNISQTGALIVWTTNENANAEIRYGTTASYGSTVTDAAYVTLHSKAITGLAANTTYHYMVISKDAAGNTVNSADMTFTTLVVADSTAPVITGVSVNNVTAGSATVNWMTNETTSTKVYYSTSSPVNKATASAVTNATMMTSHSAVINGLSANTHYYFLIESKDAANNMTTATEGAFTTNM